MEISVDAPRMLAQPRDPMDGRPRRGSRAANEAPGFSTIPLDRRRFLIVAGSAAAYLALRPHLALARKLGAALPPIQPWALSDELPAGSIEIARTLIAASILAPSHWNTQPWRFEVEGASLRLVLDPTRALPVNDPDQRAAFVSLGAALENLLIAARAYGLQPTVQYLPWGPSRGVIAGVSWTNGEAKRDRAMFAAIPERRTNRENYNGRAIVMQDRAQLSAQVPEDLRLHWIDDRDEIRRVSQLAHDATIAIAEDDRAQAERFAWTRLSDDAARRSPDGLTTTALALSGPARWFAGRYFDPRSFFSRFGAESSAKQAREQVRSAGALALLTAAKKSEAAWITGGQAFERFTLRATALGIAHHPLHEAIQSEHHRTELLRRFGAPGEDPIAFVRLGHAKPPPHTLRRGVAMVSTYRNS